ncbi:MAG TPA: hypothetical protein VFB67_02625 [Candidatus Polarisedimenticolaceae bacterium]|nr:hypothetical protein [Candidatus Polarisedimenticolaceae bacterium]
MASPWSALVLLAATATSVAFETHVALRVETLVVEKGRATPAGPPVEAEAGPNAPATFAMAVPWKKNEAALKLRLEARLAPEAPGGESKVWLESTSTVPGREPARASRSVTFAEEGTGLFEVFADGPRRLVLAIHGEQVERPVVRRTITLGGPVRFLVSVERVDGERSVPLETDELHTFIGQPVEYSFRLGEGDGLQAVRLSLLPISASGDILTIDADIGGALPGPGGTVLVHRTERIVASRLATSSVAATVGNPPAGYRFQVTPDF